MKLKVGGLHEILRAAVLELSMVSNNFLQQMDSHSSTFPLIQKVHPQAAVAAQGSVGGVMESNDPERWDCFCRNAAADVKNELFTGWKSLEMERACSDKSKKKLSKKLT